MLHSVLYASRKVFLQGYVYFFALKAESRRYWRLRCILRWHQDKQCSYKTCSNKSLITNFWLRYLRPAKPNLQLSRRIWLSPLLFRSLDKLTKALDYCVTHWSVHLYSILCVHRFSLSSLFETTVNIFDIRYSPS